MASNVVVVLAKANTIFLAPPRVYNLFLIERQLSWAGWHINLCAAAIKGTRSRGSAVELWMRFAF